MENKRSKKPGKAPTVPKILTVREVAAYLRVHPTTVYRLLRAKQFPAFLWVPNGALISIRSIAGAPSKSKQQRAKSVVTGARRRGLASRRGTTRPKGSISSATRKRVLHAPH